MAQTNTHTIALIHTHTHAHRLALTHTHTYTHKQIQFLIGEAAYEVNRNRSTVKKGKFSFSS